jgi:hypothetical protein
LESRLQPVFATGPGKRIVRKKVKSFLEGSALPPKGGTPTKTKNQKQLPCEPVNEVF